MGSGLTAVVIGGGLAGWAAAASLTTVGLAVTVVERDEDAGGLAKRRGVPQDNQLHNLLSRAQVHLEELMPGYIERLTLNGGVRAVASSDTEVFVASPTAVWPLPDCPTYQRRARF